METVLSFWKDRSSETNKAENWSSPVVAELVNNMKICSSLLSQPGEYVISNSLMNQIVPCDSSGGF